MVFVNWKFIKRFLKVKEIAGLLVIKQKVSYPLLNLHELKTTFNFFISCSFKLGEVYGCTIYFLIIGYIARDFNLAVEDKKVGYRLSI